MRPVGTLREAISLSVKHVKHDVCGVLLRRRFGVAALIGALAFGAMGQAARGSLANGGLAEANAALQAGQADAATAILRALPQPEAASSQAHNLRCRVLFALEQWDAAESECEQAVALSPQDSMNHLWLGRALGEKAENASFVTAYSLAKRARVEFEQAVQLDSRNAEALADLGEFYDTAPGVVGGGTAKAESVAAQLDRVDPARAHELRGGIAESNRDFGTAEREFRQAIEVSSHPAFQWMRLASFFRRNKKWAEMENAVQNGKAAAERDRHAAVALFNGADTLARANRDLALAIKLLNEYLASSNQTEEAPTFVAHVWLARLEIETGDATSAARERTAALAEANSYKPALELRF